jgi:hypothetical protein
MCDFYYNRFKQLAVMKSLNGSIHKDEGKLGHGFTSVDELQKIDLGDGSKPKPTYISAKLDP